MCLNITHLEPKIAEEDITVFKILIHKEDEEGNYLSPYMFYRYDIGKDYHSELVPQYSEFDSFVGKGLHSFSMKSEAERYVDCSAYITSEGEVAIVECIIPQGSKYFTGIWGRFDYACVASNALRTVKVVNRIEVCV